MKRLMGTSVEPMAKRAADLAVWWVEPSARGEGLYLIRCRTGIIADGLTQQQAITICAEYNLARSDAEILARQQSRGQKRKSA